MVGVKIAGVEMVTQLIAVSLAGLHVASTRASAELHAGPVAQDAPPHAQNVPPSAPATAQNLDASVDMLLPTGPVPLPVAFTSAVPPTAALSLAQVIIPPPPLCSPSCSPTGRSAPLAPPPALAPQSQT
jgi:hypothetical protein